MAKSTLTTHLLSFYYVPDAVLCAQDKSAKWLILLGCVRTAEVGLVLETNCTGEGFILQMRLDYSWGDNRKVVCNQWKSLNSDEQGIPTSYDL